MSQPARACRGSIARSERPPLHQNSDADGFTAEKCQAGHAAGEPFDGGGLYLQIDPNDGAGVAYR
jgi:hypothetical protein